MLCYSVLHYITIYHNVIYCIILYYMVTCYDHVMLYHIKSNQNMIHVYANMCDSSVLIHVQLCYIRSYHIISYVHVCWHSCLYYANFIISYHIGSDYIIAYSIYNSFILY